MISLTGDLIRPNDGDDHPTYCDFESVRGRIMAADQIGVTGQRQGAPFRHSRRLYGRFTLQNPARLPMRAIRPEQRLSLTVQ